MEQKFIRAGVFALFISTLLVVFTGCEEIKGSITENMNETELLTTGNVVKLLNFNGANLTKATDFPIDLSLCKISEKTPQPFLSSETGVYYLFYEYDGYGETSELNRPSAFFEFPGCSKEFTDSIIPAGIVGKNLCICQWHPKLGIWMKDRGNLEKEFIDTILEERARITDVLRKKAFNEKMAVYTGQSDSWEIKIPVEYIYNVRKNEDGMPEIIFDSEGKTYVKCLPSEKEPPVVTSISWYMIGSKSTLTYDIGEGSILNKESGYGFYRAASGINDCNPEKDKSISVTITCENGDTEEVTCTVQNSHLYIVNLTAP